MKYKGSLLLIIFSLLSLFLPGCSGNMEKEADLEITAESQSFNIEDVSFQFTDEMKEYMKAEDSEHLAVLTSLCNTWTGTVTEVSAKLIEVSQVESYKSYQKFEAEGYKIYVEPGIQATKEIVTFGLIRYSTSEHITIDGIDRFY